MCESGIADECQAAAVAVQRFQRLKTEKSGVAERADRTIAEGRAQRMRAVFHDPQIMPSGDRHDRLHVAGQSVQVRRNDSACLRCDRALQRGRIDRERRGVDVGERDFVASDAGELRNDPERERRKNDF